MNRISTQLAIVLAATLAAPAFSQSSELSQSQMTDAFNKQATRGLVLVPEQGAGAPLSNATDTGTTVTADVPAVDPETDYVPVQADEAPAVNIRIAFDLNSAAIRPDQQTKLSTLCEAMKAADVEVFQIIGHTDSTGEASYNERLSLLRAKEVERYLTGQCGMAETRLNAIGKGEAYPVNTQNTRASENRRVEIQALG